MSLIERQAQAPAARGIVTDPVRVMVVDDAVVVRGLVGRWIDEDPALAVVASCRNGRVAVDDVLRSKPDVVVLDIEMPEMDGLTALPLLLKAKPGLVVIMSSTLTRRNAEVSLRALAMGAADYIAKPESNSGVTTSREFRDELLRKVRTLGEAAVARRGGGEVIPVRPAAAAPATGSAPQMAATSQMAAGAAAPAVARMPAAAGARFPALRRYSQVTPRLLAIGSSTGGPQALTKLFTDIGPAISGLPVVITQHMPATFTAILAEHLAKASGRPAAEGRDGEPLMPGRLYVAPGGKHMLIAKGASGPVLRLDDGPQVNFCKPAVDPLFESAVAVYGSAILAAVLTGMGADGAKGAVAISNAGGNVIAQDEATSVVYGMPAAVAQAGACFAIEPLSGIATRIKGIVGRNAT